MLARLARTSYRHRRLVVLGWVVGLVLLTFVASSAGSAYSQTFRLSGADSQAATDLLQTRFPSQAGSSADIVFKATAGVKDPAIQARLNDLFARIAKLPQVGEILSPFAAGGARQISRRRHDRLRHGQPAGRPGLGQPDHQGPAPVAGRTANGHRAPGRRRGRCLHRQPSAGQHRAHRPRGRGRHPAHRLRVAAGHGPAHPHRPVRHRDRFRRGRTALASRRRCPASPPSWPP